MCGAAIGHLDSLPCSCKLILYAYRDTLFSVHVLCVLRIMLIDYIAFS